MAVNGTITGTTNNEYITPTLTWSAEQSVAGNYSDITATLTYSRTNTGYTTSGTWSGSISIGDTVSRGSKYVEITYHSETVTLTATTRVKHSGDGTCSVTLSASGGMSGGQTLKTTTLSEEVTLDTIPRASTVSCGGIILGTEGTIAIQRASSAFKHTITYDIGGTSGTICTKTSAASVSWLPPASLARQITASASANATLTVTTYSGSTEVGSKTASVLLTVPASVVPTVSLALSAVNDNATVASWQAILKGYTRLSYAVTAAGTEGASITAYRVSILGQSFTAQNGTTQVLNVSGAVTAQVTVTDSRGRTASATAQVTVQDYASPAMSLSQAVRCRVDGTPDETGSYLKCLCAASCAPVGGHNTLTCRVRYRERGGAWSGYTALTSGTAQIIGGTLSAQTTYEAELSAVDALGNARTVTVTVPTAAVAFHLRPGGTGAAFGKYAEQDELLECEWDAQFNGAVTVGGKTIGDLIYPVGSIYLSVSSTDPAALFGGTWERIKDCFLLASGDSYEAASTGGEATHTLTVDEMPSHNHDIAAYKSGSTAIANGLVRQANGEISTGAFVRSRGGGAAHNNMPPYLAVYVWQRTA